MRQRQISKATSVRIQEGAAQEPLRGGTHAFSLTCSLLLLVALIGILLPEELQRDLLSYAGIRSREPSQSFYIFFGVVAFVYLVDFAVSGTTRYLWNLDHVRDVLAHIRALRIEPPLMEFSCECYHYETRTRYVTKTYTETASIWDSTSGQHRNVTITKTRQEPETYQEKVVTYTEEKNFAYSRFEDVSGRLTPEIFNYNSIRIDFDFEFHFADLTTQEEYELQKRDFINENRARDALFSYAEKSSLRGFKEKVLSVTDLQKKPKLMHFSWYTVLSLCGLTWPYRVWLHSNTAHGKYKIKKLIYA